VERYRASKAPQAPLLIAARRLFGIFFLTHRRHAAKLCSAAKQFVQYLTFLKFAKNYVN